VIGSVSILLGNGNGTFQPPVSYSIGSFGSGIVVGDFNHDGKLDLAAVSQGDSAVSVLLGNGDGTFQPQVEYASGTNSYYVTAGDFNADGNLDLAVTSENCQFVGTGCPPGTISILFGNGDGTFQLQVGYLSGEYSSAIAAADLRGDGGADLATPSAYSNAVSVLLNLPVIGVFPNAVNFGSVKVGGTSKSVTITIGNPSGTPITISSLKIIGADAADFAQTNTCPISLATLAPGTNCTISATFKPTATGKRTAAISVTDNATGSPQTIRLTGNGT